MPVRRASAAAAAALGALLALIAGVSRTAFAMAANGDLPALARRRPPAPRASRTAPSSPSARVVVRARRSSTDLRGAIGFCSFGVLAYYAIANASALTQTRPTAATRASCPVVGLVGCVVLAFACP